MCTMTAQFLDAFSFAAAVGLRLYEGSHMCKPCGLDVLGECSDIRSVAKRSEVGTDETHRAGSKTSSWVTALVC